MQGASNARAVCLSHEAARQPPRGAPSPPAGVLWRSTLAARGAARRAARRGERAAARAVGGEARAARRIDAIAARPWVRARPYSEAGVCHARTISKPRGSEWPATSRAASDRRRACRPRCRLSERRPCLSRRAAAWRAPAWRCVAAAVLGHDCGCTPLPLLCVTRRARRTAGRARWLVAPRHAMTRTHPGRVHAARQRGCVADARRRRLATQPNATQRNATTPLPRLRRGARRAAFCARRNHHAAWTHRRRGSRAALRE